MMSQASPEFDERVNYEDVNDTIEDNLKLMLAGQYCPYGWCYENEKDTHLIEQCDMERYHGYVRLLHFHPCERSVVLVKAANDTELPMRIRRGDRGFDVITPERERAKEGIKKGTNVVSLGLALHMPMHISCDVRFRSSMGTLHPRAKLGGSCLIDARWEKEIFATVEYNPIEGVDPAVFQLPDRAFQLVFSSEVGLSNQVVLWAIHKFNPAVRLYEQYEHNRWAPGRAVMRIMDSFVFSNWRENGYVIDIE